MHGLNIHIEHDASAIAAMSNLDAPACDGVIVKLGQADQVLASTMRSNPLGSEWLLDVDSPSSRMVTWSGTLAEHLFEAHPMTWGKPGHEALAAFCDAAAPQLKSHGRILCFQPHARHVLSDPQSCLRFIRDREGQPFEIALAPCSLLEPAMLSRVEDHLWRMFESLGGQCAMVMLTDAAISEDGESIVPVALGQGILRRDVMRKLIEQHVPAETPIVLQPGNLGEQLVWLDG